jgi:hypothetical protein
MQTKSKHDLSPETISFCICFYRNGLAGHIPLTLFANATWYVKW